jgi:alkylated DNA repair protein (DNA oxidative demethylase)
MASDRAVSVGGVVVHPGLLDAAGQRALVEALRGVVAAAPLFSPETRFGRKMSVRMTSAGQFGWMSDRRGYRYSRTHPETGHPWPPIPETALAVWRQVAATARPPECCLINFYTGSARMGLHQDRDEALFRVGGTERGGPTESIWLRSGDVAVLAGPARLAHHGIDRIAPGSSMLLPQGGRINLTMRVVT